MNTMDLNVFHGVRNSLASSILMLLGPIIRLMRALARVAKKVKLHLRQFECGKSINNSKTFKFGFF